MKNMRLQVLSRNQMVILKNKINSYNYLNSNLGVPESNSREHACEKNNRYLSVIN